MKFYRIIYLGFLYFIATFLLGFLLGIFRTMVLIPRLGEFISVAIELPVLLTGAWWIQLSLLSKKNVSRAEALQLGLMAFLFLIATEYLFATLLFQRSNQEYFSAIASSAGLLGLSGQLIFAFIPALFFRESKTPLKSD